MLTIDQYHALMEQVGNMDIQMGILSGIADDPSLDMSTRKQAVKDFLRFSKAKRVALSKAQDVAML